MEREMCWWVYIVGGVESKSIRLSAGASLITCLWFGMVVHDEIQ